MHNPNSNKPYAESCEQNKEAIFHVINGYLVDKSRVLEIGSGTGQHAVYFASKLLDLTWMTSDREENHLGITRWIDDANLSNVERPISLNVRQECWPNVSADAIFSANTTHIMHWEDVKAMIRGISQVLTAQGVFLLYGPFNYNHCFTSESNQLFDKRLKQRDPLSGLRNFEDINNLANEAGLIFLDDHEMPFNNRILTWRKN